MAESKADRRKRRLEISSPEGDAEDYHKTCYENKGSFDTFIFYIVQIYHVYIVSLYGFCQNTERCIYGGPAWARTRDLSDVCFAASS